MSAVRSWAPTEAELVSPNKSQGDDNNKSTSNVNASTNNAQHETSSFINNSIMATVTTAAPPANAPPHHPRPLRKIAALSSPSRLDEAIAAQAISAATEHYYSPQQQQNVAVVAGSEEQQPQSTTTVSSDSTSPQRHVSSMDLTPHSLHLLSVSSNRRCDAFLEKIRMTSTKSAEAARMGDVAAATARKASETHSPSRTSRITTTATRTPSSERNDNNDVSSVTATTTTNFSSPSKFSSRLALAQQLNQTAQNVQHVVSEAPQWDLHSEFSSERWTDRVLQLKPAKLASELNEEELKQRQQEEEQILFSDSSSQAENNNNNKTFSVTGQAHLDSLLLATTTTKTTSSSSENISNEKAEEEKVPKSISVAGNSSHDPLDSATVTMMMEHESVRKSTTTLNFVDGTLPDGIALAEVVRGLCATKVHSEKYLEEKTEEELEEEKALAAENAEQLQQQQEQEEEELLDEDQPDYEYEAPKPSVPDYAKPPPRIPANMKELTRYVATKRDATSIATLKISRNPLAFITRSGAPSASTVAEPATEEDQLLLNAYTENGEAICEAPVAVESLGKYLTTKFLPEIEYDDDEQLALQHDADMATGEEEAAVVAATAAAAAAAASANDTPSEEEKQQDSEQENQQQEEEKTYRKSVPLRVLDLSENALGAVFPQIAPALTAAPSVRCLNLRYNGLGNAQAAMEELLPRGGAGGDNAVVGGDDAPAEDIQAALETLVKENKFVEHLNLADNEINSALAVRLFSALNESKTRVATPPPEDPPVFEPFEDELPLPEFEGEDEIIPTESELDAEEKAALAEEEGANEESASFEHANAKNDENENEGEDEEGEEGEERENINEDNDNEASGAGGADGDEEEEEELDEEEMEVRRLAREEAEARWREKMEERIWGLQRRQAERDEEKGRRKMGQNIIDALVQLKNIEIIRRKLAINFQTKRLGKERDRRSGYSRLVSLDISGNNIGSEGVQSLAEAIRAEIPMTDEEIDTAKQAAGIVQAPTVEEDWGEEGENSPVDDALDQNENNQKLVTKTKKVYRSRMVWREANEEYDEEHEEAEEYEEDEEYEEAEEAEEKAEENAAAGEENVAGEEENEEEASIPVFKTTKPGLTTIKNLNLSKCHIGFKGLQHLCKVIGTNCPSLVSLNLSNNPTCRKRIPDPVEVKRRKQEAEAEGIEFDEANIILSGGGGDDGETPFPKIIDKTWKSPGIISLADALRKNNTLRSLDLSYNYINATCLSHLAENGFNHNKSDSDSSNANSTSAVLTTLCLDGNPFGPNSGTDSEGGVALFAFLLSLSHTCVKKLSLEGCGLGACIRGATNVLAGFSTLSNQLTELRLGRNQLGPVQSFVETEHCCVVLPDVTEQVVNALLCCSSSTNNNDSSSGENSTTATTTRTDSLPLQVLSLHDNLLDSNSCNFVANLIVQCPNLISFDLSHNPKIGDTGLTAACSSALIGRGLEQLKIHKCGISSSETINNILVKTPSLVWLDAGDNNLSSSGLVEAFSSCREWCHSHLQYLSLWNPDPMVDALPLLQFATNILSGVSSENNNSNEELSNVNNWKWTNFEQESSSIAKRQFPQLRQVDFGVRPLLSAGDNDKKLLLCPWNQQVETAGGPQELSAFASDVEYLLAKRRFVEAC